MPRRTNPGAVLEITATDGLIYVEYLGRHPIYGDGIKVCPRVFDRRPEVDGSLFKDGYVAFYPATASVNRGLARIVGNLDSPALPDSLRRPGMRSGTKIVTWVVETPSGEVIKEALSNGERKLPIATIWNHEFLLNRVAKGWRPEEEG